jgi:protein O-GlcNAc transferase
MAQSSIQQTFNLALQHHQNGRLQEAERLYRQILAQEPHYVDAIQNLAILAGQLGRRDEALDLNRRVIALKPDSADAQVNLGNALRDNGQPDEAIAAFREAIALRPSFPEAHSNLGNVLRAKGQLDDAIAAFRRAIALNGALFQVHNNLGDALKDKGLADEAIAAYREALILNPNLPENHYKIGTLLRDKGQLDESIAAFRGAIVLRPDYPGAYNNLGISLAARGQFDDAIAAARQAIALRPNYFQAHNNLGNFLKKRGLIDEALAAYRQAVALWPNYAEAYCSLGVTLKDIGQLYESIVAFRRAIQIAPENHLYGSDLIYTLHFHPAYDAHTIAMEHRRWNQEHAEPLRKFIEPHRNDPDPNRRLRVGYVSPDFMWHPVGLTLAPLFENRDPRQVEIVCYSDVREPDPMTAKLKSLADQWRDVPGMSDANLTQAIRDDRIDILVDTTLHTHGNRLLVFAREPAPIQLTLLGPPISTGLSTMHYRLTDPYLDPPGPGDNDYSEVSIRIPHCFWIYQAPSLPIVPNDLPARKNGFVTLACLNQFSKVTSHALQLWLQILQSVPNSRFMLQCEPGHHMDAVHKLFDDGGIAPDRVQYVGRVSKDQYLRRFHEVDFCLDPFPHPGHTSSLDALWMGVPMVTMRGQTAVARGGVSILSNVGLTDWIADTPQQYVSIARQMAGDLPRLAELRSTLRRRMEQSPLMDVAGFARNIEAIYRRLWQKWCETAIAK